MVEVVKLSVEFLELCALPSTVIEYDSLQKPQSASLPEIELRALVLGDQKVSVYLMITVPKVTSNVQSVPRQSPDIYWN
jgi:hypothetical protein